MGIAASFLPFLDQLHERRLLGGPVLGLGSLELSGDLAAFALAGAPSAGSRRLVGALLRARYGIDDYRDADINGLADLHLDLARPIPSELRGAFATILNAGTLEHLLDLRQAFTNVHELVRPGGTIIHIAPLSWLEHGFVNFSVRLFREIAAANGYEIAAEAIWRRDAAVGAPGSGGERLCFGPGFDDPAASGRSLLPTELFRLESTPTYLLYLGAFVRRGDAPFAVPVEVGG